MEHLTSHISHVTDTPVPVPESVVIFSSMFVVAVLVAWWALSPHWAAIPEE
jgi:hypothetical protein